MNVIRKVKGKKEMTGIKYSPLIYFCLSSIFIFSCECDIEVSNTSDALVDANLADRSSFISCPESESPSSCEGRLYNCPEDGQASGKGEFVQTPVSPIIEKEYICGCAGGNQQYNTQSIDVNINYYGCDNLNEECGTKLAGRLETTVKTQKNYFEVITANTGSHDLIANCDLLIDDRDQNGDLCYDMSGEPMLCQAPSVYCDIYIERIFKFDDEFSRNGDECMYDISHLDDCLLQTAVFSHSLEPNWRENTDLDEIWVPHMGEADLYIDMLNDPLNAWSRYDRCILSDLAGKILPEEADYDNDLVCNIVDNCDNIPNLSQLDFDNDGIGNDCDEDDDNDGLSDIYENNLSYNYDGIECLSPMNEDSDGDGISDQYEVGSIIDFPFDSDNDGILDACETDSDNDGILDEDESGDDNYDGTDDFRDPDRDNDGVSDGEDNCIHAENANQLDTDSDEIGNVCDDDDDNDGIDDTNDNCPLESDLTDSDNDGVGDACEPNIEFVLPYGDPMTQNGANLSNELVFTSDNPGILEIPVSILLYNDNTFEYNSETDKFILCIDKIGDSDLTWGPNSNIQFDRLDNGFLKECGILNFEETTLNGKIFTITPKSSKLPLEFYGFNHPELDPNLKTSNFGEKRLDIFLLRNQSLLSYMFQSIEVFWPQYDNFCDSSFKQANNHRGDDMTYEPDINGCISGIFPEEEDPSSGNVVAYEYSRVGNSPFYWSKILKNIPNNILINSSILSEHSNFLDKMTRFYLLQHGEFQQGIKFARTHYLQMWDAACFNSLSKNNQVTSFQPAMYAYPQNHYIVDPNNIDCFGIDVYYLTVYHEYTHVLQHIRWANQILDFAHLPGDIVNIAQYVAPPFITNENPSEYNGFFDLDGNGTMTEEVDYRTSNHPLVIQDMNTLDFCFDLNQNDSCEDEVRESNSHVDKFGNIYQFSGFDFNNDGKMDYLLDEFFPESTDDDLDSVPNWEDDYRYVGNQDRNHYELDQERLPQKEEYRMAHDAIFMNFIRSNNWSASYENPQYSSHAEYCSEQQITRHYKGEYYDKDQKFFNFHYNLMW